MQQPRNGNHRTSRGETTVVSPKATAAASGSSPRLQRLTRSFASLLRRYRAELGTLTSDGPLALGPRARFDELMAANLDTVVDCFHRSNEQVRHAEQEREFWRNQLIRLAPPRTRIELRGGHAIVRICAKTTRDIPRNGTTRRVELERHVREAGLWDALSELSRSKLVKALTEHSLEASEVGAIEELCPPHTTYTVTSRQLQTKPKPAPTTDAS